MIRTLQEIDLVSVCADLARMCDEGPGFRHCVKNYDRTYAILSGLLNDDNFIGVIDEERRGFMLGYVLEPWYSSHREATEMALYVRPEYRGSRVAYRLIDRFVCEARNRAASVVTAGSMSGLNTEQTVRLYKFAGFAQNSVGVMKEL